MRPVTMPEHNTTFGQPDGWDAAKSGECDKLTAHVDIDSGTVTTAWELDQGELAKLLNGGKLRIRVYGGLPPMAIFVE